MANRHAVQILSVVPDAVLAQSLPGAKRGVVGSFDRLMERVLRPFEPFGDRIWCDFDSAWLGRMAYFGKGLFYLLLNYRTTGRFSLPPIY